MIRDIELSSILLSVLVYKIQADLTLPNTTVASYDKCLLNLTFREESKSEPLKDL